MADISSEISTLYRQAVEASRNGDTATANRLKAQIRALQQQRQTQGPTQAQTNFQAYDQQAQQVQQRAAAQRAQQAATQRSQQSKISVKSPSQILPSFGQTVRNTGSSVMGGLRSIIPQGMGSGVSVGFGFGLGGKLANSAAVALPTLLWTSGHVTEFATTSITGRRLCCVSCSTKAARGVMPRSIYLFRLL